MKRTFPAKVIEEEQRVIMTTAAAQAPAPGKLEFKDDYTPDEAERVIRNSKGLPVGVRPKMVWTWKKALLWAAIAIVCACGWAILAVSRGEQISAIWFLVVALSSYAIAYRFYAYYIQIKIMRTDDANATPAERVHDGANFERTDRRVLFGQHFAGISGAGPLVGPILAAQMGYLPSTLWIILGVIFAGAVQDMLVLWISAKRRGRSLGQMATDEMGKFGGMIRIHLPRGDDRHRHGIPGARGHQGHGRLAVGRVLHRYDHPDRPDHGLLPAFPAPRPCH